MPSLQPRWLILDFFAAFVRRFDDRIAIAHLIQLMAEADLDEQTVRSSVSRLKRKGWLLPDRIDGQVGYRVSPEALRDLTEGDSRVYHRQPADLAQGWCILVFSIPEAMRTKRHALRSRLTWWGFGNLSPGTWIAPHRNTAYAMRVINQLDIGEYTSVFEGNYLGSSELDTFVRKAWDFPKLSVQYATFIEGNAHLVEKWGSTPAKPSPDAFVDYLRMLNSWRSIPFLDPGLPSELLPDDWAGHEANRLFHELSDLLLSAAIGHVEAVTGRRPSADPATIG